MSESPRPRKRGTTRKAGEPVRGPRRVSDADSRDAMLRASFGRDYRGQLHIAHRFEHEHGDSNFMHVIGLGWFYWNRRHWKEDKGDVKVSQALIKLLKVMHAESFGSDNKNLEADVKTCQSSGAVAGVLKLAGILPGFVHMIEELDRDPTKINCWNGVLDLETFKLDRKQEPGHLYAKIARANYDTNPYTQYWYPFLQKSLPNAEVRAFVQRYCGYALLGEVTEHVLPIFKGLGRNGKGVFYKAISDTLGNYAHHADPSLFISKDGRETKGANPGMLDLQGKRWITVSETEDGARLSSSTMKNLVGGDTITARRLYENFQSFEPSHSIILVTNHLPKVEGDDPAVWERLRVVPWDVVIPEEERDVNLSKELRFERDAILHWMVEGLKMYWKIGLAPPDEVLSRTKEYRADSDEIRGWLEENCVEGANYKTKLSLMTDAYNMGPHLKGESMTSRLFAKELRARGLTVKPSTDKEQFVFRYKLLDPSRDS